MNPLENYYIQVFHQHNIIIKEQIRGEKKNPLFKLTYDIQPITQVHNSLPTTSSWTLHFIPE
jgi:hypothetical protein